MKTESLETSKEIGVSKTGVSGISEVTGLTVRKVADLEAEKILQTGSSETSEETGFVGSEFSGIID